MTNDELQIVYGDASESVQIGSLRQAPQINASINIDELLNKHFAILGTTRRRQIERRRHYSSASASRSPRTSYLPDRSAQ